MCWHCYNYTRLPSMLYHSQVKPIICLSGVTIFGGGLLSQPPMVDIRVEVIITGESEQKVINKLMCCRSAC